MTRLTFPGVLEGFSQIKQQSNMTPLNPSLDKATELKGKGIEVSDISKVKKIKMQKNNFKTFQAFFINKKIWWTLSISKIIPLDNFSEPTPLDKAIAQVLQTPIKQMKPQDPTCKIIFPLGAPRVILLYAKIFKSDYGGQMSQFLDAQIETT